MEDLQRRLQSLGELSVDNLIRLVDIALVAFLVYKLLTLVRGTRAWRILGGIVIFVIALFLSEWLQLRTLHWILDKATALAPVAVVILLLPELRQALEGFARIGLWPEQLVTSQVKTGARTVEEIVSAASEMAASRMGAIIVIERTAQLEEIVANGVSVNADVSAALLNTIFYGSNPLHDGAAIIRDDKVVAAACRLPLSEASHLEAALHMRHRAGVGVSEQADCVVVIVSEERGTISMAVDGTITKLQGPSELRDALNVELRGGKKPERRLRRRNRDRVAMR